MTAGQRNCHTEIAALASGYGLEPILFAVAYLARQQGIEPSALRAMLTNAQMEVRDTIHRDGMEPLDCEDAD